MESVNAAIRTLKNMPKPLLKTLLKNIKFGMEMETGVATGLGSCELNYPPVLAEIAYLTGKEVENPKYYGSWENGCTSHYDEEEFHDYLENLAYKLNKMYKTLFGTHYKVFGGAYHDGKDYYTPHNNLIRIETDGSLRYDEFEMIMPPISYKNLISKMPKALSKVKSELYTHVNHGWHIHISEEDEEKYEQAKDFFERLAYTDNYIVNGKSLAFYGVAFIDLLNDITYQLSDVSRKTHDFSTAFSKNFLAPPHGSLSPESKLEIQEDIITFIESNMNKVVEWLSQFKNESEVKIEVYLYDSKDTLIGKKEPISYQASIVRFYNMRAKRIFSQLLSSAHSYEIRFVSSHRGIENRAPGGAYIIDVVANSKKFKQLLLDTLWRYYIVMHFKDVIKSYTYKDFFNFYEENDMRVRRGFTTINFVKEYNFDDNSIPKILHFSLKETKLTDGKSYMLLKTEDGTKKLKLEA